MVGGRGGVKIVIWIGGGVCVFKGLNKVRLLKNGLMREPVCLAGATLLLQVDGDDTHKSQRRLTLEGGSPISRVITRVSLTRRVCWLKGN